MRASPMIDSLSKRAPSIVALTLCVTLLIEWFGAPALLPRALAALVGSLALLLLLTRGRRRPMHGPEERGSEQLNWIQYEIAGKGSPKGWYVLGFFCFLALMLTGFDTDYAMPAWAALALAIAWGLANATYPTDEQSGA
ncbi:hypothetical protein [Sphingomonas limnosediminicola]